MKAYKLIYLLLWLCVSAGSYAYTVESVPNPKSAVEDGFVSNPDAILSESAVAEINDKAAMLRSIVDVEMAVVAINGLDGDYIENFANQLYNYWGIGDSDRSQGILVLLDLDSRAVRIEVGDGCEGLLPDVVCEDIIQEIMIPYFADGDYNSGMRAGVNEIVETLTTDEAKAELLLGYHRQSPTFGYYLLIYLLLCFIGLLVADAVAAHALYSKRNEPNNVRYEDAKRYVDIFVFLTMLFVFPVGFFTYWFKRKALPQLRYAPMKCKKCGHEMHVLTEQQEDMFLELSQLAEERVGSVDYDVWECSDCKNHEILAYEGENTLYKRCPHCGAKTYSLETDRILTMATQYRSGRGLRVYSCANCGHHLEQSYTIPKIIVISGGTGGSGGSSSGGGFSGGSWGGGHSSGGGATGRF